MSTETKVAIWRQQLIKAETKFLAIQDNEKIAKRELGFAAQIIEGNSTLQGCEPNSLLNAVINVARTGITLNPVMKLAYLVPRDKKCVLDFSYMGLVSMLKSNGCVKDMQAVIVYTDEDYEEGIHQLIPPVHKKKYAETEAEQKERKIKGVYCCVVHNDNTVTFTPFMPYWDILRTEKTSKAAETKYSPWNTFREEMIKKTKVKRDFKMLVKGRESEQLSAALAIEEENNGLKDQYTGNKKGSIFDQFTDAEVETMQQVPETVTETTESHADSQGQTKLA